MGSWRAQKSEQRGNLRGELGRQPLIFNGIKLSCDYFERCIALSDDTLVKQAFLEQKRLDLNWYNIIDDLRRFPKFIPKFSP